MLPVDIACRVVHGGGQSWQAEERLRAMQQRGFLFFVCMVALALHASINYVPPLDGQTATSPVEGVGVLRSEHETFMDRVLLCESAFWGRWSSTSNVIQHCSQAIHNINKGTNGHAVLSDERMLAHKFVCRYLKATIESVDDIHSVVGQETEAQAQNALLICEQRHPYGFDEPWRTAEGGRPFGRPYLLYEQRPAVPGNSAYLC
jgi:hypothetical protein